MTVEQVAAMFNEAQLSDATSRYRQLVQNGMHSRSDPRSVLEKSTELQLQMNMDPQSWKVVTKSPAALKCKCNGTSVTLCVCVCVQRSSGI